MHKYTPQDLIDFEKDIEQIFASGAIKAPVHLAGGNEKELIEIFKGIESHDWVLCGWRSHYHCLLRGVPPGRVKDAIVAGRSIALCFPDFRILSSAIVGGICPIATGLAWAIKHRKGRERVHCFIGDMTARTGIYHESFQYCLGHDLPVRFIIEDNGISVVTDTIEAWGIESVKRLSALHAVTVYTYKMSRPHVGIGKFVSF